MEPIRKMLLNTVERLYRRNAFSSIQKVFEKSHNVDIASVLSSMGIDQAVELFKLVKSLDNRSEVLSHLKPEKQKQFMERLPKAEFIKLVQLMDSDDAADFLSDLSEEESQEILDKMVSKDSQEVAELMGYSSDSAGGLMTSEFLSLNQNLTVKEAIKAIQAQQQKVLFYIYAVNSTNHLVGVLSLKQLLLSHEQKTLKEIMLGKVISTHVTSSQTEVAELVERYDFLALPVVNSHNQLEGVITVDDVIDVIREEEEERFLSMGQSSKTKGLWASAISRLVWLFYSFLAGLICFSLIYTFDFSNESFSYFQNQISWAFVSFFPMALIMGLTAANQSATMTISVFKDLELKELKWSGLLLGEILISFFMIVFFSLALGSVSFFFEFPVKETALILGLELMGAHFLGVVTPLVIKKIKGNPTFTSSPMLIIFVSALTATLVLLALRMSS